MNACCDGRNVSRTPTRGRRYVEVAGWVFPGFILAILPKCPACVAAHVAVRTGLGLSLSTATYLRWSLLVLCAAALLYPGVKRLGRFAP
jgi:hypothetical protein